VRLYRGRPFRLEAHLERLERGAHVLGIPVPEALHGRASAAIAAWGGRDGALRITLTRGSGFGLAPPALPRSRLLVAVRPVDGEGVALSGIRALLRGRLDERALVSGLKTIGYLERIQAVRLARQSGADEALLRNSADLVVEGSAANLFAVTRSALVAPGPPQGALAGVTRAAVLEIARELGLTVEERGLALEELLDASEAFLTSSVRELVPVGTIEGRMVGAGGGGPAFHELAERFRKVVSREIA
jgi:branched-chain amino acid aminotransferase